jgi:hypothetical protein
MSDTNRVALRFRKETVPGTIVTGTYAPLAYTGTSDLGATPETVVSDIIRSDRQVSDLIKTNESIGGSFDTELAPEAFNDLLLGALQASAWSTPAQTNIATAGATTFTATQITNSSMTTTNVNVGDFVRVKQGVVSKFYRVTAKTATSLTVQGTPNSDFANGSNFTITHGVKANNNKVFSSFTFEREYTDHASPTFEYLSGLAVDSFSVSASASSIVTASFGLLGMGHTSGTARTGGVTTGSDVPFAPFNASNNVATIGEAGTPGLQVCTEVTMEVSNNLRERNVVGTEGASSIGSGEFNVTGQLSVYFEDNTLLNKLLTNEETSLSFGFANPDGSALIFDMPAIKFSEGVPEISGKNEDVMLNLGYQAIRKSGATTADGYTLQITRFTA